MIIINIIAYIRNINLNQQSQLYFILKNYFFKIRIKNINIQKLDEYIKSTDIYNYFLKDDWLRDNKDGGLLFVNSKKVEA